ncbi:MAG: TonB-dependent receptor [Proteobacteria bacterium]|nr:TonB-dependent receptor [Pseudomonadota bacterium]
MKLNSFVLLCFLLCISFCTPLFADDAKDIPLTGSTVMEDITVTGNRIPERFSQELAEYGHSVDVITGKQIQEAGFVDLTKAIQALVPGIFSSSRQGRGGWTYTHLHGSDDIIWLLDGVRITNPLYASDWSTTISIHQVERIEVLKGGESIFYGSGARGGVINIITKSVGKETQGQIGVSYGDLDYRETYGHVTDTVNDHGFMVFGSYEGSDGYQVCDDQSFNNALNPVQQREVGYDRSVVGAKYQKEFDLAGQATLRAQAQKQQGYFDYPYPHYRSAFNDYQEEIATLKWDHEVNSNFSYYLKTYVHTWWGNVTFVAPDGSFAWGDASNDAVWGYEDLGANLITSTTWGQGHEFISGIDYQTYWGKEEVMNVPSTDRTHTYAGFASIRPFLSFSPKTKTAAGIRYTTTNENLNSTVWDLSLKTPIWGPVYLRGAVGTSFTLPTLMQLYGTDRNGGTIGNPDLQPEQSQNLDVGVGGTWGLFRGEIGYFYQDVEDMVTSAVLTSGSSSYKNADGTTQIDGFEVQAGAGPVNGMTLNLSATWVNSEDKDTGLQVERVPEFYTTANLSYRHGEGRFGADFMARYTGNIYERGLSPFADVNYGNYFVADASVFYKFGRENRHKVSLRLENIFDRDYATRYNRVTNSEGTKFLYHQYGLPRNIIAGYTYTF